MQMIASAHRFCLAQLFVDWSGGERAMLRGARPHEGDAMANGKCSSYFPNSEAVLCLSTARHGLLAQGKGVLCAREVRDGCEPELSNSFFSVLGAPCLPKPLFLAWLWGNVFEVGCGRAVQMAVVILCGSASKGEPLLVLSRSCSFHGRNRRGVRGSSFPSCTAQVRESRCWHMKTLP